MISSADEVSRTCMTVMSLCAAYKISCRSKDENLVFAFCKPRVSEWNFQTFSGVLCSSRQNFCGRFLRSGFNLRESIARDMQCFAFSKWRLFSKSNINFSSFWLHHLLEFLITKNDGCGLFAFRHLNARESRCSHLLVHVLLCSEVLGNSRWSLLLASYWWRLCLSRNSPDNTFASWCSCWHGSGARIGLPFKQAARHFQQRWGRILDISLLLRMSREALDPDVRGHTQNPASSWKSWHDCIFDHCPYVA